MDDLVKRLRVDVFYGDERLHKMSKHNPLHMEAADRIEALEARIAKADALVEALTQIANAPSEMTWGEEAEVNATMNRMEAIADAALTAYRESDT